MTRSHARTRSIHHAGLTVPDLAAAQAFFETGLGFEIEFATERPGDGPSRHATRTIPGGLRLERFAPVAV